MSTLEYLDGGGSVRSFGFVPWKTLHAWLSAINGNPNAGSTPAKGVNRGKLLEELESRRKHGRGIQGNKPDWREYENREGFTHLEELFIYQPADWRNQAREYFFRFGCDLSRESSNELRNLVAQVNRKKIDIFMKSPILVVLFHTDIARTNRDEPLNFLLAYGVKNPLPSLFCDMTEADQEKLMEDLSPLDFFFEYQNYVGSYQLELLREIGRKASLPRLCLIKELDFSNIIGQRLAKQLIRVSVVNHFSDWATTKKGGMLVNRSPLSMIFAGPSGNGKTELARWLSHLMNKPNDDFYTKVDCGKLTDASEVFGRSGAYQGATQGSALNNFVLKMSKEPNAVGIVLLDEIEKAKQDVIHALYQVIDKGEWTNKRLGTEEEGQTAAISCHNLIFIMTTNACDSEISDFVTSEQNIYEAEADIFEQFADILCLKVRKKLQSSRPFTPAFIGRIKEIVPFLPMANSMPEVDGAIHGECMTVAKLLIERQQEKFATSSFAEVKQLVSPRTKHQMAKIVVKGAVRESGVRSIQMLVSQKMGRRVMNSNLLEKGGIENGSHVRYYTNEEAESIDFRVEDMDEKGEGDKDSCDMEEYAGVFG